MLVVATPEELVSHVGHELGVSDWTLISQELISGFAALTGDHTWIHTDPVRAVHELPGGTTIAHGYLTLALTSALMGQIYHVERCGRMFNYGVDQLRFTAPVPSGERIRLRLALKALERRADEGLMFRFASLMELERGTKPAARFENLVLMYPPGR
jgi:acyl dehydratase